jgi:hypothetical protein
MVLSAATQGGRHNFNPNHEANIASEDHTTRKITSLLRLVISCLRLLSSHPPTRTFSSFLTPRNLTSSTSFLIRKSLTLHPNFTTYVKLHTTPSFAHVMSDDNPFALSDNTLHMSNVGETAKKRQRSPGTWLDLTQEDDEIRATLGMLLKSGQRDDDTRGSQPALTSTVGASPATIMTTRPRQRTRSMIPPSTPSASYSRASRIMSTNGISKQMGWFAKCESQAASQSPWKHTASGG